MGQKTILFSFTPSLLQNVTNILNENGIGSILMKDNVDETLRQFETDPTKNVLVLSSDNKASGLNIICASNVIILEPLKHNYMFRKQIENQIIGRVHRINQTKIVNVYRMIIKDTIEEEIYSRQKF